MVLVEFWMAILVEINQEKHKKIAKLPSFPNPQTSLHSPPEENSVDLFPTNKKKQMLHTFPHQLEVFWTAKAVPDIFIYNQQYLEDSIPDISQSGTLSIPQNNLASESGNQSLHYPHRIHGTGIFTYIWLF